GPVLQRNEARAVDHSDIQATIVAIAVIGAMHSETVARRGEANPILRSRRPRRVAQRLKCATSKGDNIALVIDGVLAPNSNCRELCGRRRLQAAENVNRAGQLGKLEFKCVDLL